MRARTIAGAAVLVAALSGCGGGSSGPAGSTPIDAGGTAAGEVYALANPGDGAAELERYAALDTVDGIAFRARWRDIEPRAGQHDWSALDTALDTVRARGKKLTIHIGVSGGAWPAWLTAQGAATYGYTGPLGAGTDVVPWDPVLIDRYTALVDALASHLRSRGDLPHVRAVSDGAPVAEMSLVGCRDGMLGNVVYNRASYLAAWMSTIDAHARTLPEVQTFVSAPVHVICMPDGDGGAFYGEVMDHALSTSGSHAVFAADLNAQGSARLAQRAPRHDGRLPIAFQTLWSASEDPQGRMQGSLQDAVCQGLAAGARYFELYKADLSSQDTAVQAAVAAARRGAPCL